MAESSMWYCCQRGAREHYAVPRMLHRSGSLAALLTDIWLPHFETLGLEKLHGRTHQDLRNAKVHAFTTSTALTSLRGKFRRESWFQTQEIRNEAFEQACGTTLAQLLGRFPREVVFAFSYAALGPLQVAREFGVAGVLGQIDPGRLGSDVVEEEFLRIGQPPPASFCLPEFYWEDWRKECDLARFIVVNSEYSRDLLVRYGIDGQKIRVIPCAFDLPPSANCTTPSFVSSFGSQRPLRVLSVGQVSVRKGAHETIAAAAELQALPIEFRFVGAGMDFVAAISENVEIVGQVPRHEVAKHYQWADVLLFPTLSDGFGLVQLEALAHGVPVIASRNCAQVVTDNENGIILAQPNKQSIRSALCRLLDDPRLLERLATAAYVPRRFSFDTVGQAWTDLFAGLGQ